MSEFNNFLILGTARSGTSLLCSIINSHAGIYCDYEKAFQYEKRHKWDTYKKRANNRYGKVYGNKHPVEQLMNNGWTFETLLGLVNDWHIINIWRKWSAYSRRMVKSRLFKKDESVIRKNWNLNHKLYFEQKELHPDKVIRISYEDLCIDPSMEIKRIFHFLEVPEDDHTIAGAIIDGCKNIKQYPARDRVLAHKAYVI